MCMAGLLWIRRGGAGARTLARVPSGVGASKETGASGRVPGTKGRSERQEQEAGQVMFHVYICTLISFPSSCDPTCPGSTDDSAVCAYGLIRPIRRLKHPVDSVLVGGGVTDGCQLVASLH